MDTETKRFIDSLDKKNIPWNRMFTAYGTAERYGEVLSLLEETDAEKPVLPRPVSKSYSLCFLPGVLRFGVLHLSL